MTDVYAEYRQKLASLTAKRDETNALVAALLGQKEELNKQAEEYRLEAERIAREIDRLRGGQAWIDLKKHIAALSKLLSGK